LSRRSRAARRRIAPLRGKFLLDPRLVTAILWIAKKGSNFTKRSKRRKPGIERHQPGATTRYHLSHQSPVVFPNWRDLITAYLLQTSFQFFAEITENLHHAMSQAFLVVASTIFPDPRKLRSETKAEKHNSSKIQPHLPF
jgi:hypothetical protein